MDEEKLDIEKTLAYFTLDEKLRMLSGDGLWHTFGAGEIPRVRMSDGPNGLRMTDDENLSAVPATCYPTPSMLACSWDPALLYSVGASIGREATAMGVNLLLAPAVNIKRHPLGGRNFEYLSEDPLLSGDLGKAFISGVQSTGVGACVKHFAANNQETRRMYSDSVVDIRALREIYLKPFEIALEAAPEAVMCAYNKLNGEYCSQNKFLLTDVLRDEWNYQGVVISDWGAVHDRARALAAGLDLAMPDSHGLYEANLRAALEEDSISESDIDRSVRRILRLTDNVYLEPYGDFDADENDKLAYNAAAASIVLLKNDDGFLPLTRDMRITVCGDLAAVAPVQGGGSSHVTPIKSLSPLDALGKRGIETAYFRGYSSDSKLNDKLLNEALDGAAESDAVVVFVGAPTPHEGIDRTTLDLPPEQDKLIAELTAAGHKVVAVVCGAGPVRMPWVNRVRAIVYAGLNGQNGALAAADVLYGRINPRGKLAETFPVDLSDAGDDFGKELTPYRESIFVGYRYYDKIDREVLFPFGHGLSFSEMTYDDMSVKRIGDAEFDVTVTLTNRSVRDAYETVQLYVSDRTGRVMCAEKQLAGYMKVFVEGQTTATATVRVKRAAFEFYDVLQNAFRVADGEYRILAAASATDIRLTATVKVNGDFTDVRGYPEVYDRPERAKITDDDFAELLGSPLPAPRPRPQRGEYTLDCCLADIQNTLVGKIAKRAVMRKAKSAGDANGVERAAFTASALNTPLHAVCAMSGGAMTLNQAEGIVQAANGKFFKGLKLLLKKDRR